MNYIIEESFGVSRVVGFSNFRLRRRILRLSCMGSRFLRCLMGRGFCQLLCSSFGYFIQRFLFVRFQSFTAHEVTTQISIGENVNARNERALTMQLTKIEGFRLEVPYLASDSLVPGFWVLQVLVRVCGF